MKKLFQPKANVLYSNRLVYNSYKFCYFMALELLKYKRNDNFEPIRTLLVMKEFFLNWKEEEE